MLSYYESFNGLKFESVYTQWITNFFKFKKIQTIKQILYSSNTHPSVCQRLFSNVCIWQLCIYYMIISFPLHQNFKSTKLWIYEYYDIKLRDKLTQLKLKWFTYWKPLLVYYLAVGMYMYTLYDVDLTHNKCWIHILCRLVKSTSIASGRVLLL